MLRYRRDIAEQNEQSREQMWRDTGNPGSACAHFDPFAFKTGCELERIAYTDCATCSAYLPDNE